MFRRLLTSPIYTAAHMMPSLHSFYSRSIVLASVSLPLPSFRWQTQTVPYTLRNAIAKCTTIDSMRFYRFSVSIFPVFVFAIALSALGQNGKINITIYSCWQQWSRAHIVRVAFQCDRRNFVLKNVEIFFFFRLLAYRISVQRPHSSHSHGPHAHGSPDCKQTIQWTTIRWCSLIEWNWIDILCVFCMWFNRNWNASHSIKHTWFIGFSLPLSVEAKRPKQHKT